MKSLTDRISALSPEQRALLEKQLKQKNLDANKLPLRKESRIPHRGHNNPSPLSIDQERLWFFHQMNPDQPTYNVYGGIRLKGQLVPQAIEESVNRIIARHEAWRSTYHMIDGQPMQVVQPQVDLKMAVIDLTHLPEEDREAAAQQAVSEEVQIPFDLEKGPLLRVKMLRLRETEHLFTFTIHHIVMDRVTFSILFYELMTNYKALVSGQEPQIPEPEIQYADFAEWQRTYLQGEVKDKLISYWRETLSNTDFVLNLATDFPRPPVQSFKGARHFLLIPIEMLERIRVMAKQEGASAFMIVMAMFKALLYRYTGQEDLLVGTPFANRNRGEMERVVGYFLTNVIIRTQVSGDLSFRDLLKQTKDASLGAYAHQDLPFGLLLDELQPKRDLSRNPLFQAAFVYVDVPEDKLEFPGLELSFELVDAETAKYDITLGLTETDYGLDGFLEYSPSMFEPETIARMGGHLQQLVRVILDDPDLPLSDLPMLADREREQLLSWNKRTMELPDNPLIHRLFERQAAERPDATALVFGDNSMTYAELNRRANQVASHLQKAGVTPVARVGILMERSPEMIVAILGTLKAGGVYVPLDPAYPVERLNFMAEDAQLSFLLTQHALLEQAQYGLLPYELTLCVDRMDEELGDQVTATVTDSNLAYIIYTSGSTGQPKGVMIEHRSVCNNILWMIEEFGFTPNDRILQRTPISFDASVWELFAPLAVGAQLVLAPADLNQDITQLPALVAKHEVTVLQLVPSLLRVVLEEGGLEKATSLRHLFLGGEGIAVELQDRFFQTQGANLHNLYGPTEACIQTTAHTVERSQSRYSVPIGRPVPNTEAYILDAAQNLVPIGVPGELHIGGIGLARGYWNRPELTAERFITHPLGGRLYKTGDLARYLPDGTIEYMGRADDQVKIRGLRIELGEIENRLAGHPTVREVAVVAHEDAIAGKQLVAYVVATEGALIDSFELRTYLRGSLPEYMIPHIYVALETMPLLPNGKVNRRALAAPSGLVSAVESQYVAPRNDVEELIAKVWGELLGLEKVGVESHFFELGGHSLLATQMVSRVREMFQADVPISRLFQVATVAELADVLIAHEAKPGQVLATARLRKKLDAMSPEEMQALLQAKRG